MKLLKPKHQDTPSRELHQSVAAQGMGTVFERFEAQQPQCGFCKQGLSCQLCSNGPCRISAKAPRGVCGADGDLIVARNLLQLAVIGTAANTYQCRNLAHMLKTVGEGRSSLKLHDTGKLQRMCQGLGIDHTRPVPELAAAFADFMLAEINKQTHQPLSLMDLFSLDSRKEVWKREGIYAGGPANEIITALSKCMTNMGDDPVDLLKTALRLGLSNEYVALWGITVMQDIIMGTADLVPGEANLGCLDPSTVNIVANGHQPIFASVIIEKAGSEKFQTAAKKAGAKGMKVYGSLCEGQQLLNVSGRDGLKDVFGGQLGNWIQEELVLATGVVDVFLMDLNCSVPSLTEFAKAYGTKLISTDPVVRFTGVESIDFAAERADEQAEKVLEAALAAFKARKKQKRKVTLPSSGTGTACVGGYTTETVLKKFGYDINNYLKEVKNGNIKGAVAVAGCTTVRPGQGGKSIYDLTLELIKRNIMVIGAGCCSSTHQNTGLSSMEMTKLAGPGLRAVCETYDMPPVISYGSCTDVGKILDTVAALAWTLGCDTSQLPVAAAVPEYMEQKAIADIFTALAFGLLTHVSPEPRIGGSPLVTKYLTDDMVKVTGGRLLLEDDPVKAADAIEAHIIAKRKKLKFD